MAKEEYENVNKKELIEQMDEHTDTPKSETQKHLEAFTEAITGALKAGEEVQIPGSWPLRSALV